MRGGEHAYLHADGLAAAQAAEFLILQNLQQLGLQADIHVSDFIQQQGAAVGHFEDAGFALESSGEGAALVTE